MWAKGRIWWYTEWMCSGSGGMMGWKRYQTAFNYDMLIHVDSYISGVLPRLAAQMFQRIDPKTNECPLKRQFQVEIHLPTIDFQGTWVVFGSIPIFLSLARGFRPLLEKNTSKGCLGYPQKKKNTTMETWECNQCHLQQGQGTTNTTSWWLSHPIWKIFVKLDHFPE